MSLTFSFEREHTAYVDLIYFISLTYPGLDPSYVYVHVDGVVVAVLSCSEFLPVAAVCVDR